MSELYRFDRDLVLRAGAGAGKTHALVTTYLHLVAGATARRRPVEPSRIAAISFTEKAAADLNDQIRRRLAPLAAGNFAREPWLVESAKALGVELPEAAFFDEKLQQLGSAPVGTFHRLGGLILRRHAVEAGVDPAWRQLDETESEERLAACAERSILDALAARAPGVEELVVQHGWSRRGMGEGLVEALCRLYQRRAEEGRGGQGLDASYTDEALSAAFRQAAWTFVSRARALVDLPGLPDRWASHQRLLASTLKPLQARLLDDGAGAEADVLVRAAEDFYGAVKGETAPRKSKTFDSGPFQEAREALDVATKELVAEARSRAAAPLARAIARLVDEVARRYADDKRRLGAVDFADLIRGARDLLRDDASVRRVERGRIDALLVDEFQDTNEVQAELVRLLAPAGQVVDEETGERAGRLLVVGDRKQSIYAFRGADVGVFVRFEDERRRAGARLDALTASRRSLRPLVELANALFARGFRGGRGDFDIRWDPQTDPLSPTREAAPDLAPDACCELIDAPDEGAELSRVREARAIARRFAALHKEGRSDLALLLRSFTHVDLYLEALREAGVPYYVVNGRGFFEQQEVRDLGAALRLLDDPDDRAALLTVLRSPLVSLSDETLVLLAVEDALRLGPLLGEVGARALAGGAIPSDEASRLARFIELLRDLRRRADRLGPADVLRRLADETQYEIVLAAGFHGEQRVANLMRLVEHARAMEQAGGDLRGFVRWLARLTDPGEAGAADRLAAQAPIAGDRTDVVRVMTVHQSKGLQFSVVAIGGIGSPGRRDTEALLYQPEVGLGIKLREGPSTLDTGPSRRAGVLAGAKAEAEAMRLFYVAFTRAKDLVILAGAAGRGGASWRHLVDEARASDPTIASRIRVIDAATLAPSARAPSERALPRGDAAAVEPAIARLAPPVVRPRGLTVAVTQLADFELCPRRHHLFHVVGLAEHPRAARAVAMDVADPDLDALSRGTLAHHLLERVNLQLAAEAAPERLADHLDELLLASGYDPTAPAVAEVRGHVRGFLRTAFARALGEGQVAVRRELPFLLAEAGAGGVAVRLRGQIDLLVEDDEGVTVIDYKHARRGDPEDYRFQLDAYALAARRLFPSARRIRTGLAFLREADPTPIIEERAPEAAEAFAARVASLGAALARARADGRWDHRPAPICRQIGCGYLARCHPEAAAQAAEGGA